MFLVESKRECWSELELVESYSRRYGRSKVHRDVVQIFLVLLLLLFQLCNDISNPECEQILKMSLPFSEFKHQVKILMRCNV